ncbi:hypothetical protein SAMD00019534_045190, partial [Acytostelium subglobosum LB1]|uniref:hypothetical protein n=1 Tax=Acytostelium subglobosum LB1 TaxID=1410327 RepID=UPI000644FF74
SIEAGKTCIRTLKTLFGAEFDRNDRAKVTKLSNQFKQLSSEFEKEATEVLNLMMANAIGTKGRSGSLSLNGKDRGSFTDRIKYKAASPSSSDITPTTTRVEYSHGNGLSDQPQQYRNLEVTLIDAKPAEEMIIQEYNNEIKSLVGELEAIRDITNDLHALTMEQGEQLKTAVVQTERADMDVAHGAEELQKAHVYKSSYRKKVVILVVVLVILVAVIVAIAVPLAKK